MVRRVTVFTLALIGFVVCTTLALREAVLAVGGTTTRWGAPGWYRDAIRGASWDRAGAGGLVVLAIVVLCLVLVALLFVPRPTRQRVVELGQSDARVTVPVAVLERLLVIVLAADLRGTARVRRAWAVRRQGRLTAHARLSVVPTDLKALHGRILSLVRRDLGGASGLEVERLVLEIDRFITPEEATS